MYVALEKESVSSSPARINVGKQSISVIDKVIQRAYAGDEQAARLAVAAAMINPPQMQSFALAFHPPTQQEPWEYTRTVSCTVNVPGEGNPPVSVRCHIHYTGGVAGPGNSWISGIANSAFPTPNGVVGQFPNAELLERQQAVAYFNQVHNTQHPVL